MALNIVLAHVDIVVSDIDKSLAFYRDVLKFSVTEDVTFGGKESLILSNGECETIRIVLVSPSRFGAGIELISFGGLLYSEELVGPQRGGGSITFLVPDLALFRKELFDRGAIPVRGPFEVILPRFGRSEIIYYRDPDGHELEFVQKQEL